MTDHLSEAEKCVKLADIVRRRSGSATDEAFLVARHAIDGLELVIAHLRASRPATESAAATLARLGWPPLTEEQKAANLEHNLGVAQPAHHPVEGVSDDYADEHTVRCILQELWYPLSRDAKDLLMRLAAASRSSAAKDARIAELEATVEKWRPVIDAAKRKVRAWRDGSSNGMKALDEAVDVLGDDA